MTFANIDRTFHFLFVSNTIIERRELTKEFFCVHWSFGSMKRVPEGHRVFNMITSPCKRVRKSAINFSQKLGSPDLPQDVCSMTIPLSTAHYHFLEIFRNFLKDQRFWTFKCEIKTCEKRLDSSTGYNFICCQWNIGLEKRKIFLPLSNSH